MTPLRQTPPRSAPCISACISAGGGSAPLELPPRSRTSRPQTCLLEAALTQSLPLRHEATPGVPLRRDEAFSSVSAGPIQPAHGGWKGVADWLVARLSHWLTGGLTPPGLAPLALPPGS